MNPFEEKNKEAIAKIRAELDRTQSELEALTVEATQGDTPLSLRESATLTNGQSTSQGPAAQNDEEFDIVIEAEGSPDTIEPHQESTYWADGSEKVRADSQGELLTEEAKRKGKWDDVNSLYLKMASKGGLCTLIDDQPQGKTRFYVGSEGYRLGIILLDNPTGRLKVSASRKLDEHRLAEAMIEIGKIKGWKTMSFSGSKSFVDIARQIAHKEGIQVLTTAEFNVFKENVKSAKSDQEMEVEAKENTTKTNGQVRNDNSMSEAESGQPKASDKLDQEDLDQQTRAHVESDVSERLTEPPSHLDVPLDDESYYDSSYAR